MSGKRALEIISKFNAKITAKEEIGDIEDRAIKIIQIKPKEKEKKGEKKVRWHLEQYLVVSHMDKCSLKWKSREEHKNIWKTEAKMFQLSQNIHVKT